MATDRDLGVAVVRAARGAGIPLASAWEMTAATGVRGLRLAREAGPFAAFLLTESHPAACAVLRQNAAAHPNVRVQDWDAREPPAEGPFDYVDLDPYGSPVPFVRAALVSVRTGGVLAVTATDMMVLAGAQPAACRRRYGAEPVRGRLGPEGGLRILLAYLAGAAQRAGRRLVPLLSYVRDHHVRVYARLVAAEGASDPVGRIDPGTWSGPDVGDRGPYGPLWLGRLFAPEIVDRLEVPPGAEHPVELRRLLGRFREESTVDVPFYYEANSLARALALARPPAMAELWAALGSAGYSSVRTHVRPSGFRTDAPRAVVAERTRELAAAQSQKARVRA